MTDEVAVELLKEHTHNKVEYPVGFRLSLAKRIADWLVEQKVAVYATGSVVARPTAIRPTKRGGVGCCGGGWR